MKSKIPIKLLPACFLAFALLSACAGGSAKKNNLNDDNNTTPPCGNQRLDPGEECDDGNTLDGDGCSAACRRESLYPGFIQVVNGRILYRDEPLALIAAAFLPQGATDQEALQAGFNLLLNGSLGLRMMWVPHGASVTDFIAPYVDDPGVLGWVGPDEPLWNGLDVETVRQDFVEPVRGADPWGRPILLNHAPRGSRADPANFDLLLPYMDLSDIATMDIYPIPEGNGHSILPDHPGLSAVGEHTRLLADIAARAGGHNAVAMILAGAGMGRIPSERWEMVEHWCADDAIDFDQLHFVQAGDYDGDGAMELAVGYTDTSGLRQLATYDFQENPFGGRKSSRTLPATLALDATWRTTAGDYDGDGRDDLLLVVDASLNAQELWLVSSTDNGFDAPLKLYSNRVPEVVWNVARQWLSADFDGDSCDDLLFSYDYPDPEHQVWFLVASNCNSFAESLDRLGARRWFDASEAVLDLSRVRLGAVWKQPGALFPDVFLAGEGTDGKLEILRMTGRADGMDPPQVVLHDAAGTILPSQVAQFSVDSFRGQPDPQFVLTLSDGASLRLLAGEVASLNSESQLESWLQTAGEPASHDRTAGGCSGDFDGDGLPDLVLPVRGANNRLQLDVAFSTGRFFGARDPLPAELRFMALDAFIRGAQGVIFWGQEFVDATHVSWSRLKSAVAELALLRPHLQGETLFRSSRGGFSEWWVRSGDATVLFVARETRTPASGAFVSAYDPGTPAGSRVARWNGTAFTIDAALPAALPFSDPAVFGAYEVRIYMFE